MQGGWGNYGDNYESEVIPSTNYDGFDYQSGYDDRSQQNYDQCDVDMPSSNYDSTLSNNRADVYPRESFNDQYNGNYSDRFNNPNVITQGHGNNAGQNNMPGGRGRRKGRERSYVHQSENFSDNYTGYNESYEENYEQHSQYDQSYGNNVYNVDSFNDQNEYRNDDAGYRNDNNVYKTEDSSYENAGYRNHRRRYEQDTYSETHQNYDTNCSDAHRQEYSDASYENQSRDYSYADTTEDTYNLENYRDQPSEAEKTHHQKSTDQVELNNNAWEFIYQVNN